MNKIVIIGSNNMDLVIQTNKVPDMGETVLGFGFKTVMGGKGGNQAIAAARLGCQVSMIGAVGNDAYGKQLIKSLEESGVCAAGVRKLGMSSGIAVITVCGGDNFIILDKGANGEVTPQLIDENLTLIEQADIVVLQFEIPYSTVEYAAKLAKRLGKKVILNPAPMMDFDLSLLKYTDIFIPNQNEAAKLLSMPVNSVEDAKEAVLELCRVGAKQTIITLGKNGCVYNREKEVHHFKAYDIKAVDTTAAGDSFIGGICKCIREEGDIAYAIRYATAVSALTVSKPGAASSIPYAAEVEQFLCKDSGKQGLSLK